MGNTGSGGPDWEAGWRFLKDNLLLKRSTAFVLLLLGLVLLVVSGFGVKQGYDTLSWTMTGGTVVRSGVNKELRRKYRLFGDYNYQPDIQYRYSVNGRQYSSTEISLADWFMTTNLSEAEEIAAMYPLNGKVPAYYDPNHPDQSLLEIGIPGRVIWALVGGGVTVILAIVLLVAIFKNNKRKQD